MKTILVTIALAVLIGILLVQGKVRRQVKRMKTLDSIGQVYVTLSKTLNTNQLDHYDAVAETRKQFPSIPITNNQIADAWGNPIRISIKRVEKGFRLDFASAGADGVIDTKDDVTQGYMLFDE